MFYPKLWSGKSDRSGEVSKREGNVSNCGNRYRWDHWGIPAKTVYKETKRNPKVCRVAACNSFREFNSTEDPCNQGTDWEYLNLKKRDVGCMIEKTSLWSFSFRSCLFHFNWQFVYFIRAKLRDWLFTSVLLYLVQWSYWRNLWSLQSGRLLQGPFVILSKRSGKIVKPFKTYEDLLIFLQDEKSDHRKYGCCHTYPIKNKLFFSYPRI